MQRDKTKKEIKADGSMGAEMKRRKGRWGALSLRKKERKA